MVQHRTPSETKRPSDLWHSDLSYLERPASATVLYAIELPEPVDGMSQGDTMFVDMVAAFVALPPAMQQQLRGMHGLHRHPSLAGDAQTPQLQAGQATVVAHPLVVKTQAYQTRNDAVEEPLFALNLNPAYTIALQNNGAAGTDAEIVSPITPHLTLLVSHCQGSP